MNDKILRTFHVIEAASIQLELRSWSWSKVQMDSYSSKMPSRLVKACQKSRKNNLGEWIYFMSIKTYHDVDCIYAQRIFSVNRSAISPSKMLQMFKIMNTYNF